MIMNLRWLDWIFLGEYLPSLSINYVAKSKDMGKNYTTVLYKDENFLWVWVLLQSESPWQSNDDITFFIYLCVSLYEARRASPIIASLRNRKAEEEAGKTIVCDKRDRAIICMFCRGLH